MRLLFVIGTRPEAIKLYPLIVALKAHPQVQTHICITGQHRQMMDQFLKFAHMVPDTDLNVMEINQSLAQITTKVLAGMQPLLDQFKPDRVIVHGDTSTTHAGALSAFYKKIPVSHIEAGLRSHDLNAPWPEEANRRMVSILCDQHFAPTAEARENLLREGFSADSITVTGNTVIDALLHFKNKIETDAHLRAGLEQEFGFLVPNRKLVLVTCHRRENYYDGNIVKVCDALLSLAARPDVQVVWPVHQNPKVRTPVTEALKGAAHITLLDPQDYLPFIYLMNRAHFILTDSGGVQEEAPTLGKPLLVLRESTERPEVIESGCGILVGTDPDKILEHATSLLDDPAAYARMSNSQSLYGDGKASERIVEVLLHGH